MNDFFSNRMARTFQLHAAKEYLRLSQCKLTHFVYRFTVNEHMACLASQPGAVTFRTTPVGNQFPKLLAYDT